MVIWPVQLCSTDDVRSRLNRASGEIQRVGSRDRTLVIFVPEACVYFVCTPSTYRKFLRTPKFELVIYACTCIRLNMQEIRGYRRHRCTGTDWQT